MDKQKQIEEMVDLYIQHAIFEFDKHGFSAMARQMYVEKARITMFEICSMFFEKGYRKIPEGAVVLTEEELKEKIDCCDVSMIHHDDDGKRYIEYEKYEDFTDRLGKRIQQLKGQLKQTRKETAEKFADKLRCEYIDFDDTDEVWVGGLREDISKICKEITGVEG